MWRLLRGTMGVKSLVQGLNAAATAGFEPRTVWSEVRRRNRLATAPPLSFEVMREVSAILTGNSRQQFSVLEDKLWEINFRGLATLNLKTFPGEDPAPPDLPPPALSVLAATNFSELPTLSSIVFRTIRTFSSFLSLGHSNHTQTTMPRFWLVWLNLYSGLGQLPGASWVTTFAFTAG